MTRFWRLLAVYALPLPLVVPLSLGLSALGVHDGTIHFFGGMIVGGLGGPLLILFSSRLRDWTLA